jgi:hypothetical protein
MADRRCYFNFRGFEHQLDYCSSNEKMERIDSGCLNNFQYFLRSSERQLAPLFSMIKMERTHVRCYEVQWFPGRWSRLMPAATEMETKNPAPASRCGVKGELEQLSFSDGGTAAMTNRPSP